MQDKSSSDTTASSIPTLADEHQALRRQVRELAEKLEVAEAENARIWVESSPGQGSTVRFTLPANPQGAGEGPTGLGG